MITDSNIDNGNKQRQQQNNGKVHLKESSKRPSSFKKKAAIIGDLMAKNIKHCQLNRSRLLKDQPVSFKSFPGATIRSMKHYIQAMLKENESDKILLLVGTNDLSSAKNANKIASEIMKLVDICKR